MAKPSETTQIEFIKDCLRKGEQRKTILAKFVNKWQQAGTRTFDRRLKQAQKDVTGEQQRIQSKAEVQVAKEVEARKTAIMTAIERQELLSELARAKTKALKMGTVHVMAAEELVDGVKVYNIIPNDLKIKAIAELNKMDGSYSPDKHEHQIAGQLPSWLKPK